jgi:hypothetical protein
VNEMSKQKIGAREAVKDIKSGMTDADLMEKYGLSSKGLDSLFEKLVQAKALEESFIHNRTSLAAAVQGSKSEQSSAPVPEPTRGGSETPSELDQAILQDIKDGRHDNEIMRRHEVSPGQLKQIKASLTESGLLVEPTGGPSRGAETRRCPSCSQEVAASASECPECGRWLEPVAPNGPEPAAPAHLGAGVVSHEDHFREESVEDDKECPWEDRESYGTLNAYFQTATKLLLTPTSFFSKLPTSGGYFNPILFAAMSIPIAIVLTYLWVGLFSGISLTGLFAVLFAMSCVFVGGLIFVPIGLAIWSALLHLCLYVMGEAREGYEATFRVVSYSTVTSIFNAIPVVGSLASLWSLVLNVIGLREVHKTTTGKAVAAVAIPLIVGLLFAITLGLSSAAKLGLFGGGLPKQACLAVETFIVRVDGAAGLDADPRQAEVQAAMRELVNDMKPFQDKPRILLLQQKAILFGMATIQQAKTGTQFGKGVDELREELRKTCRK